MNRKRERIRIAKKEGWHRGHSQQDPVVIYDPQTEIELCMAYDEAWGIGINAPSDAVNPFGIYDDSRVRKTGWYKKQDGSVAHFFNKGATKSCCGMMNFNGCLEPVWLPPERTTCKACRK